MSEFSNTIIIIPVFNSRDSVIRLIQRIQADNTLPIVLVDDGSQDGLQDAVPESVTLLRHPQNRGKGTALKTGLAYASKQGFDQAVTLDADGQHDPGVISCFIKAGAQHPQTLIVGRRDFGHKNMPWHRIFSNSVTSLLVSLRCGIRIYDSQVGYRCYPLSDNRLWRSPEDGFQFESAVFFNAARLSIPLAWIPIPVIYDTEGSHMHLLKDTLRFIRTYFRSFMC